MKILVSISLFCVLLLTSCVKDSDAPEPSAGSASARFQITAADYNDEERTRATGTPPATVRFDKLIYYIFRYGQVVGNAKIQWRPDTSELIVEGLQEGNYELCILAIQGDEEADHATIHSVTSSSDIWLSFPEDQTAPLQADYFYKKTVFWISERNGVLTTGSVSPITMELEHLVAGIEFSFAYNNPYVRTSLQSNTLVMEETKCRTAFTADGWYSGESLGGVRRVKLGRDSLHILRFMPGIPGASPLRGRIEMHSRDYTGKEVIRSYNFTNGNLMQNRLNGIHTQVVHPEDNNGVLYMTPAAFEDSRHGYILQDDEPKGVYSDPNQRRFVTTKPLQAEITDEGKLHLRFYSPRPVKDVTIRARIPSVGESVTLAYLDSLPAFADVWLEIPAMKRSMTFPTVSGGYITLPPLTADELRSAELIIESGDAYWTLLQKIEVPWTIRFDLMGGDPYKPDGGPASGWIGIRPVHCREAVAFMLNVTYMFGLEEVTRLMHDNAGKLVGNDGVTLEPVDRALWNMRKERSFAVGLVRSNNGAHGLGSPSIWGVVQPYFYEHYSSPAAAKINFHELGHVMDYRHESAFTYGVWDEQMMNVFYVRHISEFPIDKSTYLDSRNNPCLYTRIGE